MKLIDVKRRTNETYGVCRDFLFLSHTDLWRNGDYVYGG